MTWNLFIDDERNLSDVTWAPQQVREKYLNENWVIARNMVQVAGAISRRRCMPWFISFDHDLGKFRNTGHDIAKWLVEMDMVELYRFPKDFDYYVHSQNPIGKANIEGLLNGYFKARDRIAEVPFDRTRADELFDIAENDDYEGDITVGKLK